MLPNDGIRRRATRWLRGEEGVSFLSLRATTTAAAGDTLLLLLLRVLDMLVKLHTPMPSCTGSDAT